MAGAATVSQPAKTELDRNVVSLNELDALTIVLGSPKEDSSHGYRIPVKRKRPDGKLVSLILEAPTDYDRDCPDTWNTTYGVKLIGEKGKEKRLLSFFLYDRPEPKPYQVSWVNNYNEKIVKTLTTALLAIKKDIKRPKLTLADLNNETLSRLKMLGNEDSDQPAPVLNTSIRDFVQAGVLIKTETHDFAWNKSIDRDYPDVPVKELEGVRAKAKFEVLIESIYAVRTISIQTKTNMVCFKPEPKEKKKMHFGHNPPLPVEPNEIPTIPEEDSASVESGDVHDD